tara:strand:- start:342 stop:770 length:429 start_codon:yes stop_codon:yes gene_type:complete
MDIFEDLKDYEGYYQINPLGKIKNIKKESRRKVNHIMAEINVKGYLYVCLSKDGKSKRFAIHRLVAIQYIPNTENKQTVDHIDRNKSNNNLNNLRWATMSEQNKNTSRNVTPQEHYIKNMNRNRRHHRWISIAREFRRILKD